MQPVQHIWLPLQMHHSLTWRTAGHLPLRSMPCEALAPSLCEQEVEHQGAHHSVGPLCLGSDACDGDAGGVGCENNIGRHDLLQQAPAKASAPANSHWHRQLSNACLIQAPEDGSLQLLMLRCCLHNEVCVAQGLHVKAADQGEAAALPAHQHSVAVSTEACRPPSCQQT